MSEHDDDANLPLPGTNLGISRRRLLQRGAVVGGVLVWAAPTIRTLGTPAFATGSPPPPDDPEGHAISYIAVVVRTSGGNYRAKFNVDEQEGPLRWEGDPGPPWQEPTTGCYPTGYSGATAIDGGAAGLVVAINGADPSKGTLTVPATVTVGGAAKTVQSISAAAFGGLDCQQIGLTAPYVACVGGCVINFDI